MIRNLVSCAVVLAIVCTTVSASAQCNNCGSSMPVYSTPITYTSYNYQPAMSYQPVMNCQPMMSYAQPASCGQSTQCCGNVTYTTRPVTTSCCRTMRCSTPVSSNCGGCRQVCHNARVRNCGSCCNQPISNCGCGVACGGCSGSGQIVSGCVGCANSTQSGVIVGEGAMPPVVPNAPVVVPGGDQPQPTPQPDAGGTPAEANKL